MILGEYTIRLLTFQELTYWVEQCYDEAIKHDKYVAKDLYISDLVKSQIQETAYIIEHNKVITGVMFLHNKRSLSTVVGSLVHGKSSIILMNYLLGLCKTAHVRTLVNNKWLFQSLLGKKITTNVYEVSKEAKANLAKLSKQILGE